MPVESLEQFAYVRGPATYRKPPAFEFKAPDASGSGGRGGGYARVRSWEVDPDSASGRKYMAAVPIHRLCAVAWLFEDDMTAAEILESGELVGADVHHTTGMRCVNTEDGLELRDHGEHSSITQSEKRAWAETAKRQVRGGGGDDRDVCPQCGDDLDGDGWTIDGIEDVRCLDCTTAYASQADDATVRPA